MYASFSTVLSRMGNSASTVLLADKILEETLKLAPGPAQPRHPESGSFCKTLHLFHVIEEIKVEYFKSKMTLS